MTTIYLLRHGVLAGDGGSRFVGQTELPLSDAGIKQVTAIAQALKGRGIEAVHCSDLQQSRQTAGIVAEVLGVGVTPHRELRDVFLGEWEGMLRKEVAARWPDQFASRGREMDTYRPPGGESFRDCLARAWPVWNSIARSTNGAVAIVAENGINRLLLCRLLGMPTENMFRLGQDCGCVSVIERDRSNTRVRLLNGQVTDLQG